MAGALFWLILAAMTLEEKTALMHGSRLSRARECGECHGVNLDGVEAPPLRGADFLNGWAGQTTDELITYVQEAMPPGLGGSLGPQVYLNIVAYILAENGARPGDVVLTSDATVMIGDAAQTVALSNALFTHGVLVSAIRPPTVPTGTARLRVTPMATHTQTDLEEAVDAFRAVGRDTGYIK